ncbi:MAG: hypothetical protein J5898_07245 [Lachnospiraceae bacterium]|nr:hypothetical protein [Lachnospiraceae bacterium]
MTRTDFMIWGISLIVLALCMTAGMLWAALKRKKRLTAEVTAECIRINEKNNSAGSSKTYEGVFRYDYRNRLYRSVGIHSVNPPSLGEKRMLLINPDQPEEIYDTKYGRECQLALGRSSLVFFTIGILMIFLA